MNNIYHYHLRLRGTVWEELSTHKIYDLTLAVKIDKKTKEKPGAIVIGVAIVSHRDSYSKKEGNLKAKKRLMYNPTFIFPLRHRNAYNSMKYWIEEIKGMAQVAPTYLRDLILNKQQEFDKTPFGIQVKQTAQNLKAEEKAEREDNLKQIIEAGRASAPERKKAKRLAQAEKLRLKNLK